MSEPPRWMLVSDIDGTLTGDDTALAQLMDILLEHRRRLAFGVASGRSPELIRDAVARFGLTEPDLVIASVGSEIYGPKDLHEAYRRHIAEGWSRRAVLEALEGVSGLRLQGPAGQRPHKVSFVTEAEVVPAVEARLNEAGLRARLIHSHGQFLDVLPARASKGQAVRFVSEQLGLPLSRIVVAGDSGNDADMLCCGAQAVAVGNYDPELGPLLARGGIYVAQGHHAAGVLEGLEHFGALPGTESVHSQ